MKFITCQCILNLKLRTCNHTQPKEGRARTTSRCAHDGIKAELADRINSLMADVVEANDRATVAQLNARPTPPAKIRPTNDTAPKKLPENQKLESTKKMPAKKPCMIKRYGPKAVKAAVQVRPAIARHPVTATGTKTGRVVE